mgnify:CR=1 FL=1
MFIYDKKELIRVLKTNLEFLEKTDLPEKFKIYHTLDTGGYGGDLRRSMILILVFLMIRMIMYYSLSILEMSILELKIQELYISLLNSC